MGAPNRGPKVPFDVGGTKAKKVKSSGKKTQKRGGGDSLMSTLVLVGAGIALEPLLRRAREWFDARRRNTSTSTSGGVSPFGFGKKGKKAGKKAGKGERATKDEPMRKPPGAASTPNTSQSASMPRSGKMQSNKKSKARKALERRDDREAETKKDARKPGQLPGGAGKTVVTQGNNVPKDEDILGGEAGKTFTTTSHTKVPVWYAKVREERGTD